jgi:hypothetical protein
MAARIPPAAAAIAVEQLARHVRVRHYPSRLVLKLHQTAAAAAVAQRLPLVARELVELFTLP